MASNEGPKKSLLVAYFLWFWGGFCGLHHFYLGRDRHAFVTWMSFSGYFGCGWLRDLWMLPEYVRDVNEDKEYLDVLTAKMRKQSKPSSSVVRHCGIIIVADILGYLFIGAIPLEYIGTSYLPYVCALIAPLGVAVGVDLVGNIGRHRSFFYWPLAGAYLTAPLYLMSSNSVFWTSLCSSIFFNKYGKEWRRTPTKRSGLLKRISILSLCVILYLSLWCSWFYFNCAVVDKDDQEIKCRDAAKNFLKSPAFREFTKVLDDLRLYFKVHGWQGLWREVVNAMDPQGEANALKVLNLTSSATQEQITAKYRELSRQWHPDRHKDPDMKMTAQERFIEIQEAYEILSKIKMERKTKNQQARSNPMEYSERDI